MNLHHHRTSRHRHRGLTLMEAVIALGIIAVAVPLVLSATAVSSRTRINAETDTRSAWLARTVQRELTDAWRTLPSAMFTPAPTFPNFASATAPEVLLFDAEGRFLARGNGNDYTNGSRNPNAVYLVSVHSQRQNPANITTNENLLARVQITVAHNAKSPLAKRIPCSYTVLIPRQIAP
jgi:type II secretory pathway pseudopilin PulG